MQPASFDDERADLAQQLYRFVRACEQLAVFLLDADGKIVAWNTGAGLLTGYDAADLLGRHVASLYPAAAIADQLPARDLDHARTTGTLRSRGDWVRKDGSLLQTQTVLEAVRDGSGQLLGFGGVLREITADRPGAAAPELDILAHDAPRAGGPLDRRVHDLNNLLTVILGNAEALVQRLDGRPDLQQLCETIADAAVRGAELARTFPPVGDR